MGQLFVSLLSVVKQLVAIFTQLLPGNWEIVIKYLLFFTYFKVAEIIGKVYDKNDTFNVCIGIPSIIVSIACLLFIYQESTINDKYIVGLLVARKDFGFDLQNPNYKKFKKFIFTASLFVVFAKIAAKLR